MEALITRQLQSWRIDSHGGLPDIARSTLLIQHLLQPDPPEENGGVGSGWGKKRSF